VGQGCYRGENTGPRDIDMYFVCSAHAFEPLASRCGDLVSSYTETKHWWTSFARTTSRTVMWSDFVYTGLFWGKQYRVTSGSFITFLDINSLRSCIDEIVV
jgi:hypothetical protein